MATLVTLPLLGAVLCVNCETISNSTRSCSVCGSEVLRPLSLWIGTVGEHEDRAVLLDAGDRYAVRVNCCYPQFTVSAIPENHNRAIARELIANHRAAEAEKARTA